MKTAKKKTVVKRKPSLPKLADTAEICRDLSAMAGPMADPRRREKIYKAVRQLQLLDKLATDAGLLPRVGQTAQVRE